MRLSGIGPDELHERAGHRAGRRRPGRRRAADGVRACRTAGERVMVVEQFSLAGKAALVIGASNPLGRASAVALAEAGADVAVATTTRSQQEEVAANSCANEIWALDRKGFAQAIDAADERDVDSLVERAVSEFGRLD
ncbi:MAG: SDR family NAD(P)-dependent oxidoreductase, partial [Chloroflexi bacterium]